MTPPPQVGPIPLLERAPPAGTAPIILAREPGFAIKLLAPEVAGAITNMTPPGQGQLLLPLRGEALVKEVGGSDGKVIMTVREGGDYRLPRGHLFRVANDAQWGITTQVEGTLVLCISTSVPREADRVDDVLGLARNRVHVAPRQLFSNESMRMEFVVARGRIPFRGWLPYAHTTQATEYSIVLAGAFSTVMNGPDNEDVWSGELPDASLLRVPPGARHRFSAAGSGVCIRLVVSSRIHRDTDTADGVAAFTPFARP